MKFTEAFKAMKEGSKAKLPSWGGYWRWDPEKETIIMHTKDRQDLDIRETQVVEYTIGNILSDEWIIADETNCPQLGGEATFSFSEAVKYLRRGMKISRKGWNGKGQYVRMVDPYNDTAFQVIEKADIDGTLYPYFALKNAQNGFIPWVPSTGDLLADDWIFA
ncbi:MAG: DUF2829 domain-containing protein [Eubacteriales bacterium]|nr:DUF2829 domain-containing protein [Eubacteriales bacterium]